MSQKKTCRDSEGKIICEHATALDAIRINCDRVIWDGVMTAGCITCMGGNPYTECYADRTDAEFHSPENQDRMAREDAKRKADDIAWLNRPKIDYVCKKCGTATELGLEEYTDGRSRRKIERRTWCKKCYDDDPVCGGTTPHEWRFKSCSTT